jgi:hypothetical protein
MIAWAGLPQYATAVHEIRGQAAWWAGLALVLPFLAAMLLGLSAHPPASRELQTWVSPVRRYLGPLAISVIGTLIFALFLLLVGFLLYKMGIHAG